MIISGGPHILFRSIQQRERERVDLFNWISRIDVPTVLRSQRANEVGYLVEAELKSNQN